MRYADVCVNSPIARQRAFTYSIPAGLDIVPGQAVWVPFGSRLLQGIILGLTDHSEVEETRDIDGLIESRPMLSSEDISLARWISGHYLSPLFDAAALFLPPGYERNSLTVFSLASADDGNVTASLDDESRELYEQVRREGRAVLGTLEKQFGLKKTRRITTNLVKRGVLSRIYEMEPVRAKVKTETLLRLEVDPGDALETAALEKRSPKRAALLAYLAETGVPVILAEARKAIGFTRPAVDNLVSRGLVSLQLEPVRRDPLAAYAVNLSLPLEMTGPQSEAFGKIKDSLERGSKENPDVFLLHGVTGSGKTEVYLQALAETVRIGKKGIVLVPEISLTPQTVERFVSRFPGRVAVLHSGLSLGEQYDEWHRVRNGEADVVIGPRSAVFAPQSDLGLIILDEEHEWTYKQHEQNPRYHAREVAIRRAALCGATVVLGSATPDIESYYRTETGEFTLLELRERVTPVENTPLPEVEVVDLKDELKSGNRSMFSRSLAASIEEALRGEEQVMLFLNRRGAATFIQCRDCGYVVSCRRCDIPMTYHLAEEMLVCHRCNNRRRVPDRCPSCKSKRIKYLGAGTQKLEQEAAEMFPGARLLRWDSDVTGRRGSHWEILRKFRDHEADILIGTQMITKGLDLPRVTLVGVVSADIALNLPDFRAGERTFQLLSQVAGRAGRGYLGGKVIIQTYSPEHYAVKTAAAHDYRSLYQREIAYRRQLHYPPFTSLAALTYTFRKDESCRHEAEKMRKYLAEMIAGEGNDEISLIGPAPAFVHRVRGNYRWQLVLRGSGLSEFLSRVPLSRGWTVDIDPVGV